MDRNQYQRLIQCLVEFVERVSKGEATAETEVEALPAVAKILLDTIKNV